MKIFLIIPWLHLAGVPLAQLRFARALKKRGHSVEFIIGRKDPKFKYEKLPGVIFNILNVRSTKSMLPGIMKNIKNKNPDIIFSAEDHMTIWVLIAVILLNSRILVSGSSRVGSLDLEAYGGKLFSKHWKSFFLKILFKCVAWRADVLTCVSQDMVEGYHKVLKTKKHTHIYNIIVDEQSITRSKEPVDHKWLKNKDKKIIVAAGRLDKAKGFHDLIDAIHIVIRKRDIKFILLGDGPEKENLREQIIKLNMEHCIDMVGYVENPLKYFAKSDVFVLASYAEGLPNVLVEAMMCNCSPVSTDCPTGPREVLQDGNYGRLVPIKDPHSMASAIVEVLDNPISESNLLEAIKPFTENIVIERHFDQLGIKETP
jgi:glycosyltransferase involved in cell wall biosynthesis